MPAQTQAPPAMARRRPILLLRAAGLAGTLLVSACQTFSPDGGMDVVAGVAGPALDKQVAAIRSDDEVAAARATLDRLLGRPLTADTAVQVALLDNRGLQAAYDELAAAEARMVGESLPPNPSVSLVRIAGSAQLEIERRIVTNILALATLPARSEIARLRFHQAQLAAALETLRVATRARRAWVDAVAAREVVGFLAQAEASAGAAAELSKRLTETGAANKLDRAREQVFHAETSAQLAAARQRATSAREALIRALGLGGRDLAFRLPDALPALPVRPRRLPAVEAEAIERRVDLQIARLELDALARSYGLTRASRFINVLDAGYADKITKDELTNTRVHQRGFELELQVPLFDFGEVRVREAQATYLQAVDRLAETAVNVRSQAREAFATYRSAYDIATRYQRDVLPLRATIADETQLRYGAMQIDEFALLAEARQRINSIVAAVDAKRDFWLASADLSAAIVGGRDAEPTGTNASRPPAPASAASDH
jgi:outer membrane protein TolC